MLYCVALAMPLGPTGRGDYKFTITNTISTVTNTITILILRGNSKIQRCSTVSHSRTHWQRVWHHHFVCGYASQCTGNLMKSDALGFQLPLWSKPLFRWIRSEFAANTRIFANPESHSLNTGALLAEVQ